MTSTTMPPGGDNARPDHADLRRYQKVYQLDTRHDELHQAWQEAYAHALLLEADGDRVHADCGGLNGRQLAEGARLLARHFALRLAEAPARSEEELNLKIAIYETVSFDHDEDRRSHIAIMVEMAMHYDALALGIMLSKRPVANGPGSGSKH